MKPCGTVFTASTQRKLVIVPGMLGSPFIVLGFNACFALGIKIYSFLCPKGKKERQRERDSGGGERERERK